MKTRQIAGIILGSAGVLISVGHLVVMMVFNTRLADRDHKRVYQLDKAGQEKAREFAGQKVKVTGRVVGKTIKVTAIEAAT